MQVVIFKINDEQFAVESKKVHEINDTMNIKKVPQAPPYIKGLVNLRGNIISILDINMLLNMKEASKEQSNVIILNIKGEQVGITVEQVNEVLEIAEDAIEELEIGKDKGYIQGIINFKHSIATLINLDNLNVN